VEFAMNSLRQEGREAIKVFGLFPFAFVNRGELLEALKEHYSRRQAFQILSQIEKNKKKYGELYKTFEYRKLYDELKEKFLS
jgi:hydrogenase maturation factor